MFRKSVYTSSLEFAFISDVFHKKFGEGVFLEGFRVGRAKGKDVGVGLVRPVPVRLGNEVAEESFLFGNFRAALRLMLERGFKIKSTFR